MKWQKKQKRPKQQAERKAEEKNNRFDVEKLEERMAPTVFITPSGNVQILPHHK